MASFCINETWTNRQVCELLERAGLEQTRFEEGGIDGKQALKLKHEDLTRMGITDRKKNLEYLNVIKNQPKVFNDPIHGSIELHPVLVKIIDTPQFQRLWNIKQLGGSYYVYPGACHSRFEHSIGVAHLAGELGKSLKNKQSTIISDRDILCVQIAGLCHDLGHGPFSHLFDELILRGEIRHEKISIQMFDYLVEENGLRPLMKLYDLRRRDRTFIKEMIHPPRREEGEEATANEWPYEGRPKEKSFLYEIVSNKTSGVDVDKFDYFARDCHYLGLRNNFDHQRFMLFARVCKEAGNRKTHICIREKEVNSLYTMYQTRYYLHKRACQHKVKYGIDLMIKDALDAANGTRIGGLGRTLNEVKRDIQNNQMASFTQLTDFVFQQILDSANGELANAKRILRRINSRDLYKCVFEREVQGGIRVEQRHIDNLKQRLIEFSGNILTETNFEVVKVTIDYGMGHENPVNNMYYYTKQDPDTAIRNSGQQIPHLIPEAFSETVVRVYYKETDLLNPQSIIIPFDAWHQRVRQQQA
ncbi:deoxynucleoside triphosphate triphosphohydrolase SAMHD1-like [Betta splendens]|uniref:Deoxynucleoside triphosphate triphosphohydrolase SAMHD1 n=1 Tax=Betta splendens TaxID=158456 RepID=A0A9W2XXH8_BETSP|nr:deoxynucleoside triphosphate triphosphohydrolase SAMHD1-like [Betta splendens]